MKLEPGKLYKFKDKNALRDASIYFCMCSSANIDTAFNVLYGTIDENTIMFFAGYENHNCLEDIDFLNTHLGIFLYKNKKILFRTFQEEDIYKFSNCITSDIYNENNFFVRKRKNIEELLTSNIL